MGCVARLTLVLALTALWAPSVHAARQTVIAVMAIKAQRTRLSPLMLPLLRDYLAAYITAAGAYRVVPDERTRKALVRERRWSYHPSRDPAAQITLGKDASARKSLATRIMRVGSRCLVTLTLYDLASATAEQAATTAGPCSEDRIMASLGAAMDRLIARSRPMDLEDCHPPSPLIARHGGLRSACHRGRAAVCRRLGWLYQVGKGTLLHLPSAAVYYGRACSLGDGLACSNLGYLYLRGMGLACSPSRALGYYTIACTRGSLIGCNNLADMYESGQGVARDSRRAAALYRRACAGGFVPACR